MDQILMTKFNRVNVYDILHCSVYAKRQNIIFLNYLSPNTIFPYQHYRYWKATILLQIYIRNFPTIATNRPRSAFVKMRSKTNTLGAIHMLNGFYCTRKHSKDRHVKWEWPKYFPVIFRLIVIGRQNFLMVLVIMCKNVQGGP